MKNLISLLLLVFLCAGCAKNRHAVVTATATNLGIDFSQNPATQLYQVKVGYNRGEIAVVPTNRSAGEEPGAVAGGATDAVPVITELRMSGFFSSGGESALYQRLAVGSLAVNQPGAALMFAKDRNGAVSPETASAIVTAFGKAPAVNAAVETSKVSLGSAYAKSLTKVEFDKVAQSHGYSSFSQFLIDVKATQATVNQIATELKTLNLL